MASRYTEKDPVKCWDLLAQVLSYGDTIPYVYKKTPPTYRLSEGIGGWGYNDNSSSEYLLDDIQFALFDQRLPEIQLHISGVPGLSPLLKLDWWKPTVTITTIEPNQNKYTIERT